MVCCHIIITDTFTRVAMNPIQSADISTARDMKCLYSCNLYNIRIDAREAVTLLDLWKKLVNSRTDDGEYSIRNSTLVIAACASPPPDIACILLDSGISTPDPSRVAWFYFASIKVMRASSSSSLRIIDSMVWEMCMTAINNAAKRRVWNMPDCSSFIVFIIDTWIK